MSIMSSICKTIFSLIYYNLEEIKQVIRAKRNDRIIITTTYNIYINNSNSNNGIDRNQSVRESMLKILACTQKGDRSSVGLLFELEPINQARLTSKIWKELC